MTGGRVYPGPKRDPWSVALHAGPADPQGNPAADRPLGAGVLVDQWRVLTCASVLGGRGGEDDPLWVAFPKAGVSWTVRRRVVSVRADAASDIAVLVLAESAPPGVQPARLSCPDGADLVGEAWWTFGFPVDAAFGSDAFGFVGASLAYGWVRLDAESPQGLTPGFLGAGVWSPRFEAVIGVIGRVHAGGQRGGEAAAVTLLQIGGGLTEEALHELAGWKALNAGESALAAWGWSLATDAEAVRHWRPRARGVAVEAESGYRFRGRRAALTQVVEWLGREDVDDRVLVVTGSPGVGKSAVLGRVVTTADEDIRQALPPGDDNVLAEVGSVACAVHVKGKTALDVAVEIAKAAAVRIPKAPAELAPVLRQRLAERHTPRFNMIIDALDEAVSPEQAQQVVEEVVLPVVRTCGPVGAQVVVGTRRSDDGGDLMQLFGADCLVVDLDDERFFEVEDLAAYAQATLQLVGSERAGNPYASSRVAGAVAARIAVLADRNFLVAGLTARQHGMYDAVAVRPEKLVLSSDVDTALATYVSELPDVGRAPAKLALTALAYAQAPGLSLELWRVFITALGATVSEDDLADFARSSAANFLVESSGELPGRRFRLFHQALNDALVRERRHRVGTAADQRLIADRLIRMGRDAGWGRADRYLLRSLAEHAAGAGMIDDLLVDDEYLLYADLLRLTPPADYARTILGQQRARLLRLTPQAAVADPAERAAQFSVTAALESLDARVVVDHRARYRAAWAAVQERLEWAVLEGHTNAVEAVCALRTRNRGLVLVTGGSDGTVRVWNPNTAQPERVMLAGGPVIALRPVTADGRTLIASAGADGMVILWDPDSGQARHSLQCEAGQVRALTASPARGADGVGIVCADGTMTVWTPGREPAPRHVVRDGKVTSAVGCGADEIVTGGQDGMIERRQVTAGRPRWSTPGHSAAVVALCLLDTADGAVIASAGADRSVRIWDAASGTLRRSFDTADPVRTLCPVTVRGTTLLAGAGDDSIIRLWDPHTGRLLRVLPTLGGPIRALSAVEIQGRPLLASAGGATVRLWDPDLGGRQPGAAMASQQVTSLAAVRHGSKEMVACGHADGSVQLRSVATGEQVRVLAGHRGPITDLASVYAFGGVLLASSSSDDTVRLWTPEARSQRPRVHALPGWSTAVCAVSLHRQLLLACGGEHGTVRLSDPFTGKRHRTWRRRLLFRARQGHAGPITALCSLRSRSGTRIASGGHDCTVRVWNLDTDKQETIFTGHKGRIRTVCALLIRGVELIVSAGDDQVIRIWDPRSGTQQRALHGHTGQITSVCPILAGGRALLASTSHDGTARIWNPVTGAHELTIAVHHEATACIAIENRLIIATAAGTLAVTLTSDQMD
jgi:WD40 repeat protein